MPSAAPDTDAATSVDGTAQPIGGCPHHLGKDKDGEAVRRSQWGPGSLGLGGSQTSFRMGALSEVYLPQGERAGSILYYRVSQTSFFSTTNSKENFS